MVARYTNTTIYKMHESKSNFIRKLCYVVSLTLVHLCIRFFERQLEQAYGCTNQCLAKTMLVLMVRGLFSGLQFPYVQFPCSTLQSDQMFLIFWKTVGRLERYRFKVMGLTCDGLAANRMLFHLHAPRGNTEIVHKVKSPHSTNNCDLFFISDPPHLIKTIRNCFASKNRHLWVS